MFNIGFGSFLGNKPSSEKAQKTTGMPLSFQGEQISKSPLLVPKDELQKGPKRTDGSDGVPYE